MHARFSKWGNSVVLRIPDTLVKELDVAEGSAAQIAVRDGSLVVTPLPTYTLDQLLDGMTAENMYREIRTGELFGNEAW